MNKGLEALQEMRDEAVSSICRYTPRQVHEEVTGYFDKRKSIIEKELKEHEQYKAIEEDLGLPLNVWVFLAKNQLKEKSERVYIENTIDDEKERERTMKVNGRPQRFILGVDFDKKYIQVQGTADEWCFRVPFKNYGKTWALTKEELL